MTVLNEADTIRVGTQTVSKVYAGAQQVWPSGDFDPATLAGLVTWLDSPDYTPGSWPNKGTGPAVSFVGSPAPTTAAAAINGRPAVRFKASEGRLRSAWLPGGGDVDYNYTLLYLVRWIGPTVGRAFSGQYPPTNLLAGFHTSGRDMAYDNGTFMNSPGGTGWSWTSPGPWRMYGLDCVAGLGSRFYIDGTLIGAAAPAAGGLINGWAISGYSPTGLEETCDIELAELILYDHRLSDSDRHQLEDYLQTKWFAPTVDPATQAYMTATGLDASYTAAIDNLVTGLKSHGLWSKMAAIYPFAGGTAALHKWNLKDPRDLDAAYRLTYSTPDVGTHSTSLGYRPNATHDSTYGYADTHLVPAGTLDPASVHLSLYSLTTLPAAPRCDMGNYNWGSSGGRFHLIVHYTSGEWYYSLGHTGTPNVGAAGNGSGMFLSSRTSASLETAYLNGAAAGSNTNAPVALPPVSVLIGALHDYAREASNLPFGFASIGSGLTAQNAADLYTVVQAFQTALGRQV